jgi:hypothetical protein
MLLETDVWGGISLLVQIGVTGVFHELLNAAFAGHLSYVFSFLKDYRRGQSYAT